MWQHGTSTRISLHRKELSTHAIFVWANFAAYDALDRDRALFLHPNELAYYQRLPARKRQQSYLLGRYVAKQALVTFLETAEPTHIEVASGIFTQPVVKFPTPEPVAVSISHAGDFACALAFAQIHPMALDIEPLDTANIDTMQSQILPQELQAPQLLSIPEVTRCAVIWTAKEALSKILKCGMMSPFSIFETTELKQEASRYVGHYLNFGQYKFHAWVMNGHVISIALPKRTTMELDVSTLMPSA